MSKKKVYIFPMVVALVLCASVLFTSEDFLKDISISGSSGLELQGLLMADLPEPVRLAVEAQSERNYELKVKQVEEKKARRIELINKSILGVSIIVLGFMIYSKLISGSQIGNKIGKVFLYRHIKQYRGEGKTYKDIEDILNNKGYDDVYIEYALNQYKRGKRK